MHCGFQIMDKVAMVEASPTLRLIHAHPEVQEVRGRLGRGVCGVASLLADIERGVEGQWVEDAARE